MHALNPEIGSQWRRWDLPTDLQISEGSEQLMGPAEEYAKIIGLSHATSVTTYLRRYSDFPKPVVDLSKSRVRLWRRQDIVKWCKQRSERS